MIYCTYNIQQQYDTAVSSHVMVLYTTAVCTYNMYTYVFILVFVLQQCSVQQSVLLYMAHTCLLSSFRRDDIKTCIICIKSSDMFIPVRYHITWSSMLVDGLMILNLHTLSTLLLPLALRCVNTSTHYLRRSHHPLLSS